MMFKMFGIAMNMITSGRKQHWKIKKREKGLFTRLGREWNAGLARFPKQERKPWARHQEKKQMVSKLYQIEKSLIAQAGNGRVFGSSYFSLFFLMTVYFFFCLCNSHLWILCQQALLLYKYFSHIKAIISRQVSVSLDFTGSMEKIPPKRSWHFSTCFACIALRSKNYSKKFFFFHSCSIPGF